MPTSTVSLPFRVPLSTLIDIGKGRLRVRLNGTAHDVYDIDFLTCASYSAAATALQTALNAAAIGATFTVTASGAALLISANVATMAIERSVRRLNEAQHVIHKIDLAPNAGAAANYGWGATSWTSHDFQTSIIDNWGIDALISAGCKNMLVGWYGGHPTTGYPSGSGPGGALSTFPLAPAWYAFNSVSNPNFHTDYVAALASKVASLGAAGGRFIQYLGMPQETWVPVGDVPTTADYLQWLDPLLSLAPGHPEYLTFMFDAMPALTPATLPAMDQLRQAVPAAGARLDGEAHPSVATSNSVWLDPTIGYGSVDSNLDDLTASARIRSTDLYKGGIENIALLNRDYYFGAPRSPALWIKRGFTIAVGLTSPAVSWRSWAETNMLLGMSWDTDLLGDGVIGSGGIGRATRAGRGRRASRV